MRYEFCRGYEIIEVVDTGTFPNSSNNIQLPLVIGGKVHKWSGDYTIAEIEIDLNSDPIKVVVHLEE